MTLARLARDIRAVNQANGWHVLQPTEWGQPYKIPALLALIMSEASEALEAFRHDNLGGFEEELADIIIRVLDCAEGLGFNMDMAVERKLIKNRLRGYRHGGKRL